MKILISHSWQDKSAATQVFEALENDGHEVWYDVLQLVPGDNIQQVIDVYIKKCDAMVLLWSIHAFGSEGVDAEIETAHKANKRIIPLLMDTTPLNHHAKLKGILGIPMEHQETGLLLLRRAFLFLMASDADKKAEWFNKAFGNVVDLGGYLNYVNTYRLPKDLNNDGNKEAWRGRLEKLLAENEYIKNQLMPAADNTMLEMQEIMKQLEHGEVDKSQLQAWMVWCDENANFHPELIAKLKGFIQKDIDRLNKGGEPIHAIDFAAMEQSTLELEKVINLKKQEAYDDMHAKIKSYLGWLVGNDYVVSVAKSYQSYVVSSAKLMRALIKQAKVSESVAVHETAWVLHQYLAKQKRSKELKQKGFDGLIDDAYFIQNATSLLVEAGLVKKKVFPKDPHANGLVRKYISFIIDANVKERLDKELTKVREMIGLKKDEINWGQVAVLALGAVVVAGTLSELLDGSGDSTSSLGGTSRGGTFEDNVGDFSANNGGGLTDYLYP